MSLSDLPDPNKMLLNNLFGLGFGRRNMYTTDNEDVDDSLNPSPNVTVGYVVAMRASKKSDSKEEPKRICFIYMKSDQPDEWGSQYSWTVDKTACLRNIR